MLFDTHAHLNFAAFKDDADEVIKRSLDNGIWMVNVGSQYSTSKRAVEMAERYPEGIYAAVGLHPIHLETGLVKIKTDPEEIQFRTREEQFDYEKYRELAKSPRVVAIGEAGLDYYWKPKTQKRMELFKEKQRTLLCQQLDLARDLGLPLIFHCRMAHNDLLEILSSYRLQGVVHCFTGDWEQAEKYLKMGFHLGFNGLIFKMNFNEIIKKAPLEKILIETDCPYLTPPQEQPRRNEPIYLTYIAQKIAELKNLNYNKVADVTTKNARELFNI
jgi:TatD DNase family protein